MISYKYAFTLDQTTSHIHRFHSQTHLGKCEKIKDKQESDVKVSQICFLVSEK